MTTEPSPRPPRRLRDLFFEHPGWTALSALATVASVVVPLIVTNGTSDRAAAPPPAMTAGASAGASAGSSPSGVGGLALSPTATPSPVPPPSAVVSPVVVVTGHAGSPSPVRSPSQRPSASAVGVVQVSQGTWVDWDTGTPTLQGTTGEPPTPVDLRIGPDNAYPENSARLWRTDSPGSCATQAASNGGTGFQTELDLHAALQPQAGSTISACLVTTGRRVTVLTISSAGDNTFAPYKIQYRLS